MNSSIEVNKLIDPDSGKSATIDDLADFPTSPQISKAWVNFNGVGVIAIRDSFNITSITDQAVGSYTVNLTKPFINPDFSIVPGSSAAQVLIGAGFTASQIDISTGNASGTAIDASVVCVNFFGVN